MNCSVALQILPLTHGNRMIVIDEVIAFLQSQPNITVVVTPFETV